MKRTIARIALMSSLTLAVSAGPAVALRDDTAGSKGKVTWELAGGSATPNGVSADGPKSSNAYAMQPVSYVFPRGYWDMALADSSWKLSYTAADIDGAGQLRWSVALSAMENGELVDTGHWLYLDPYHCPGAANSAGWATTDFQQSGSGCAIYGSWRAEPYVGTDAVLDGEGNVVTPATSAWTNLVGAEDLPGDFVYYGFVIVDEAGGPVTVDRVMAGGNLLSKF